MNYLDFDLAIQRIEKGKYRAYVIDSPCGEASITFTWPFDEKDLEIFLLRMGYERRVVRGIDAPEVEAAKTFGQKLFTSIFSDQVRSCLLSSLEAAEAKGMGLRIRLRLTDAPELVNVPWEYLYNPAKGRFLVLSQKTPLIRYVELSEPNPPLQVNVPLRILVMISSPSDYSGLDTEKEWTNLREALRELEESNQVILERLDEATLTALNWRLARQQYHIFHFIGHGGFEEGGVLIMEDAYRRSQKVTSEHLATILADHSSLRLAILNSCEGARTTLTDTFAGTAQRLVLQSIPAVIAMQFEITDPAAITFAHEFYHWIADGLPVDTALAQARRTIYSQGNGLEWGTPVIYMRSPDGCIFNVHKPPPPTPLQHVPKQETEVKSYWDQEPRGESKMPPLNTGPLIAPSPSLELPEGIIDSKSHFYINRKEDSIAIEEIKASRSIIIKAPGQMGRSTLLQRVMETAEEMKRVIVYINFQRFSTEALTIGDRFFKQFCNLITFKLRSYGIEDQVEAYWEMPLSNIEKCAEYLQQHILVKLPEPLFLAMDELDCFFDSSFRSDFYTMLRTLRSDAARYPILRRIKYALVTSAEPVQFIDHGSPMNLGRVTELRDFKDAEVSRLNLLHGKPLDAEGEKKLMDLLGGHPYLVRRALYKLAEKEISLESLLACASSDSGLFGNHLKYLYWKKIPKEEQRKGLREILSTNSCQDEFVALHLTAAGLIRAEGQTLVPRCKLYEQYFKERLRV